MYSNINIYAFFIILLCFAPLISADGTKLRTDYYNASCPTLLDTVWLGVGKAIQADPKTRISLIKMHFHDCLVNGCDASLLLDDTTKVRGEKGSFQNENITALSYKVIDDIKKDVEASCPKIVSCADILTLAATASIKLAFKPPPGPHGDGHGKNGTQEHGHEIDRHGHDHGNGTKLVKSFGIPLGRLDAVLSNRTGADHDLPSDKYSIAKLITMFAEKGLDAKNLFTLAGAYKIGTTLNNNGTKFNVINILTPLDWNSNTETAELVKYYNQHPRAFIRDFWVSMVKISKTDVITAGDPRTGEIRRRCGVRNSK